jgi:chemotaxis protein methyltransferase CheR
MPLLAESQVTDELLSRYASLIYDVTGIRISQQKKALLSNRLRRRLRQTGIASFEKYYMHLKRLKPTDAEWDAFLQEITTHETYLFRDDAHWQWLQQQLLPQVADDARQGTRAKTLRIWSAACSTGDEAFSIAACIAHALPGHEQWQIKILGTDIGVDAVQQATTATFGTRSMRLVPEEIQERWFVKLSATGPWQARTALRAMTEFRRHNLLEALKEAPFDLIFLKNVLIYFDAESKKTVVEHVRRLLKPGGYLVAGAAEGISDLVRDLQRHHAWLYTKTNYALTPRRMTAWGKRHEHRSTQPSGRTAR